MIEPTFLVIDCESNGLYGESFAVGYVLVNRSGKRLHEGLILTELAYANGLIENSKWVQENVKLELGTQENVEYYRLPSLNAIREAFWTRWTQFKQQGACMAADCLFPVESSFLVSAVNQHVYHRQWNAPYPFIDISTLLIAVGKNSIEEYERLEDEKPKHNPLMDARQSARIMIECFDTLGIYL